MFSPCRSPGCKGKGRKEYQGYCAKHKASSGWFRVERDNGNRHERGYGSDWEKLRQKVFERDEYLCCLCSQQGMDVPAITVDHIIPKSRNGSDDMSNLQSLCEDHHKNKTAMERFR